MVAKDGIDGRHATRSVVSGVLCATRGRARLCVDGRGDGDGSDNDEQMRRAEGRGCAGTCAERAKRLCALGRTVCGSLTSRQGGRGPLSGETVREKRGVRRYLFCAGRGEALVLFGRRRLVAVLGGKSAWIKGNHPRTGMARNHGKTRKVRL
ncbi:hypothetical protein ERJ75_000801700 [Trypanosoma vivax]|nr:hypothetical protein ERJ75_000801700 [Trypanosoma vivax]